MTTHNMPKVQINPRTYTQIHTPSLVQGGWNPSPEFLICCSISKRFCLLWKAFDLLEFDNVRNTFETKEIEILTKAKMKHNIYLLQP